MGSVTSTWGHHRLAISPWAQSTFGVDERYNWVDEWLTTGSPTVDFLADNGIAGLWLAVARRVGVSDQGNVWALLRQSERSCSALYMAQTAAVREFAGVFEASDVVYALMKGAAWRDELYEWPHLRSAADLDVLVPREQRERARDALSGLGFARSTANNSAHEETWSRGSVDVDLHWDVLAPGRTAVDAVGSLLSRRVLTKTGVWRLADTDMVALSLVHTAIAKYVCCRHSTLNRVIDLLCAVRTRAIDWSAVADVVCVWQLRGAAWATMTWVDLLTTGGTTTSGSVFPADFKCRIAPSKWRRRYIEMWVQRDFPGLLEPRFALLVQVAFTLPMHDSVASVRSAVRGRFAERGA